RKALDDAELLRRSDPVALRDRRRGLPRHSLQRRRPFFARALDRLHRRPFRSQVVLALAPVDLLELPVPVAPALDRLPAHLAGQEGRRTRGLGDLHLLIEFGVCRLGGGGEFAVEGHGWAPPGLPQVIPLADRGWYTAVRGLFGLLATPPATILPGDSETAHARPPVFFRFPARGPPRDARVAGRGAGRPDRPRCH